MSERIKAIIMGVMMAKIVTYKLNFGHHGRTKMTTIIMIKQDRPRRESRGCWGKRKFGSSW